MKVNFPHHRLTYPDYDEAIYVPLNTSSAFYPPIDAILVLQSSTAQGTIVEATIKGETVLMDFRGNPVDRIAGPGKVWPMEGCTFLGRDPSLSYLALRRKYYGPSENFTTVLSNNQGKLIGGSNEDDTPAGPSVTVTGLVDTLTANIMTDADPTSEELGSLTGIQIRSDFGVGFLFTSQAARDSFVDSYNSGTWALTIGGATTTAAITAAEDFNTALATTRAYLVPSKFPSWEETLAYPYDTNYGEEEAYSITFT